MTREKFRGMNRSIAELLKQVLEGVYGRLDDIGVEVIWTYGGYVLDVNKSGEIKRLLDVEDVLAEIGEVND